MCKARIWSRKLPSGHVGVVVQGSIHVVQNDGTEVTANEGDAYYFAPGHDGWIVGDETFIGYEFSQDSKDFGPWKTAE